MFTREDVDRLLPAGGDVLTNDGDKIGSIAGFYVDEDSGEPLWVAARTGLFGGSQSLIPLQGSRIEDNDILVPYTRDQVKDAPRVAEDGNLDQEEEDRLFEHYGTGTTYTDATRGTDETATYNPDDKTTGTGGRHTTGTIGHHTSGRTGGDGTTRSEERPNVGTEKQDAGGAGLRKYGTTENATPDSPGAAGGNPA
jgi:hypothetical protein